MDTYHWKPGDNEDDLLTYLHKNISTNCCLLIKDDTNIITTKVLDLNLIPVRIIDILETFYGDSFYLDKTDEGLEGVTDNKKYAINITPFIESEDVYWDLYGELRKHIGKFKEDYKETFKNMVKHVFSSYNLPTNQIEFIFTNPNSQLKVYKDRSEIISLTVDISDLGNKSKWELKIIPDNIYLTLNK